MNSVRKFFLVPENEFTSRRIGQPSVVTSTYKNVLTKQSELENKKELKSSKGIYEGLGDLLNSNLSNGLKMRIFNDLLGKHLDKKTSPKRTDERVYNKKIKERVTDDTPSKQKQVSSQVIDSESEYFDADDNFYVERNQDPKRKDDVLRKKIASLVETDKRGRVLKNDRVIVGSNIKKIVNHIVSGSNKRPPAGTSHVLSVLKNKPLLTPIIIKRKR